MATLFLFALGLLALYAGRPLRDGDDRPHLQIKRDLRLRARMVFALRGATQC